jgi:phospholipid-binding lipoprotein MlaA
MMIDGDRVGGGMSRSGRGRLAALVACTLALLVPLQAAASTGAPSDPFEPMNRAFFGIHQVLDHYFIRPAAVAYRRILPKPLRKGIANMISNLGEPSVFVNDVLQGHGKMATYTFTRFGLLGVFDVATPAGLPHHPNDFGISMARYGVAPGPYLFVPLAGPITMRDAVGAAAGLAMNPLVFFRYSGDDAIGASKIIGGGLEARSDADQDLKTLMATATDPYASLRSFYLQNRQAEVTGGRIDIETLPDFGAPDAAPAAAASSSTPSTEGAPAAPTAAEPSSPGSAAPAPSAGSATTAPTSPPAPAPASPAAL